MKMMWKVIIICLALVVFYDNSSWAVTKAWIIGTDKAIKINTATNSTEKELSLNFSPGELFVDAKNGRLFNLHQAGRYISEVGIVDIKTLQGKGKLDLSVNTDLRDEVQILFSSTGTLFYLRWVRAEGENPEIKVYNSSTLKPVKKYTTSPQTTNQIMLSENGDMLYSLVQDGMKIDTFDTNDFSYKSSVDITKTFTLGSEGGFSDYKKGSVLVSEVITRAPQLEYFDYIYSLSSNTISNKVRAIIKGSDFLIPVSKKIAIHERQYIGKHKSMRLDADYQSSGKIHFFDTSSGKEIGLVNVPIAKDGKILGVTPAEDKLFFVSYGADFANPTLNIIDLKTYFVVSTRSLPEASVAIVFFEE